MQTLSVKQAATKLRKSEATIRRWAASGKLKAQKSGRYWEIFSLDLNSVPTAGQPEIQSELSQETIERIVDGVSHRIVANSAVADSSSELESRVKNLSWQNDGFMGALQRISDSVKKLKNDQERLLTKISLQEQLLYQQTLQIARLEASSRPLGHSFNDSHCQDSTNILKVISDPRGTKSSSTVVIKPANTSAKKPSGAKVDSEQNAEKWVRANTAKWLDDSCRAGRSWRELATNVGELVSIRNKMQKPRSHLHIIAKTDNSAWNRIKAKVALELFPSDSKKQSSNNHYEHEFEIGGG